MTPITREAIRLVRESNDFALLDCLELLERRHAGERDAVAIARWCGRTLIGYGSDGYDAQETDDCPACDGTGELEATGANGRHYDVRCPECDGDGCVDSDGVPVPEIERLTWRTLNGDPAEICPHNNDSCPKLIYAHDAAAQVAKARAAIDAQPVTVAA